MKFSADTVGGERAGKDTPLQDQNDQNCDEVFTMLDLTYSPTSCRFHPDVRQIPYCTLQIPYYTGIPYAGPLQHAMCAGGKGSAAW